MGRRRRTGAYPISIDELAARGLRIACRKTDLKPVPEDPYGANRLGGIHPFDPPTRSEGGFSRQVVERRPRVCRWILSHRQIQKRDRLARRRPQASHRTRAPAVRADEFFAVQPRAVAPSDTPVQRLLLCARVATYRAPRCETKTSSLQALQTVRQMQMRTSRRTQITP